MRKISRQIFSFWNIVFFIAVVWIFYQKVPTWISQFKAEGRLASSVQILSLDGKLTSLPFENRKQVIIFWATWCGPCGVELARLNRLVENGTLSLNEVVAISIMEDPKIVLDAVHERGYAFLVFVDENGTAANQYQVQGTPTIYFVDQKKVIRWVTTGLSPTLEYRVQKFLEK